MAFVHDNEDINSICLTAVRNLMTKYDIPYTAIGRLEVGTETLLDKSKSTKSVLMQLFAESGNTDIEGAPPFSSSELCRLMALNLPWSAGIDTTNACYGGTAALFNTVAWVESSAWDGRYGLVVAGDIAVYGTKSTRPTGGCGVVVMLIGPDAPLALEPGLRASHMEHVYDFYKPDFSSEYPTVDGKLSNACYLRAVDNCYKRFAKKVEAREGAKIDTNSVDYFVFHTPYVKLVQKSVGRLVFMDFMRDPTRPEFASEEVQAFRDVKPEETYDNAVLEKVFRAVSEPIYKSKVVPGTLLATNVGNCYCGSTYASLLSLISNVPGENLLGKRIVVFSYGSGLASSMFSIRVKRPLDHIVAKTAVMERLAKRIKVPPAEYIAIMEARERAHNRHSFFPESPIEHLFEGTFYLTAVNDKYHRFYSIKSSSLSSNGSFGKLPVAAAATACTTQ